MILTITTALTMSLASCGDRTDSPSQGQQPQGSAGNKCPDADLDTNLNFEEFANALRNMGNEPAAQFLISDADIDVYRANGLDSVVNQTPAGGQKKFGKYFCDTTYPNPDPGLNKAMLPYEGGTLFFGYIPCYTKLQAINDGVDAFPFPFAEDQEALSDLCPQLK